MNQAESGLKAIGLDQLYKLPGAERCDFEELRRGRVALRFTALDPLWKFKLEGEPEGLLPLRNHLVNLCRAMIEIETLADDTGWAGVTGSLHLAASLTDVFADTDIFNNTAMCSNAAEYEDANSELAAKHLAAVNTFNLVWIAYEVAAQIAARNQAKIGKGALGRTHLRLHWGDRYFPYLKEIVWQALAFDTQGTRALRIQRELQCASLAAIGAEQLRVFRNRLTHGELLKPEPSAWRDDETVHTLHEPAILKFHANIRLVLTLIQIVVLTGISDELEEGYLHPDGRIDDHLMFLHCHSEPSSGQLPLDYLDVGARRQ